MGIRSSNTAVITHRRGTSTATKASVAVGLTLALIAGCTPSRSSIDPPFPYEGSVYDEHEIQQLAAIRCGLPLAGNQDPTEITPFTTDGCSMYPDGGWLECCIAHDIDYWCANDKVTRAQADRSLKACVTEHSNALNGQLTLLGTRVFGHAALPFPWRWGYGYPWLDIPTSADEQ